MSYQLFFSFSQGLAKNITVPEGMKASISEHIAHIERILLLKLDREAGKDHDGKWIGGCWNTHAIQEAWKAVDDELLCTTILEHNNWVRCTYDKFAYWSQFPYLSRKWQRDVKSSRQDLPYFAKGPDERFTKKPNRAEKITSEEAAKFWHVFYTFEVPVDRWSIEYYRNRMDHIYETMRGNKSEGVTFEAKPLTTRQAANVILLFSEYLDKHDLRLDVPKDRDLLKSSYDGGYSWCDKCGQAIDEDDDGCSKRGCPLKACHECNCRMGDSGCTSKLCANN